MKLSKGKKKQEIKQYNFYSEWQITPLSFNSDGEMCQNMSGKLEENNLHKPVLTSLITDTRL